MAHVPLVDPEHLRERLGDELCGALVPFLMGEIRIADHVGKLCDERSGFGERAELFDDDRRYHDARVAFEHVEPQRAHELEMQRFAGHGMRGGARQVGVEAVAREGDALFHARVRRHVVDGGLQIAPRALGEALSVRRVGTPVVEQEVLSSRRHEARDHEVDLIERYRSAYAEALAGADILVQLVIRHELDAGSGDAASGLRGLVDPHGGGGDAADACNALDDALHAFGTGGRGGAEFGDCRLRDAFRPPVRRPDARSARRAFARRGKTLLGRCVGGCVRCRSCSGGGRRTLRRRRAKKDVPPRRDGGRLLVA